MKIGNSIKYSNNDGEIYITCFEKVESIVISIKDNGVGIPQNHRLLILV